MTLDQWLLLGFAFLVFLAAVVVFVIIPSRRRRLVRVPPPETPPAAAPAAATAPPVETAPSPQLAPETAAAFVPPPADGPPDDLRQIKGIGPKLAARLAELGITRFRQIADLSDAELAALDARLGSFQGRPERDRWREQARLLAEGDLKGFERLHGRLGDGA
ncbi:MAG: helix-hairpin-helix domain-containing protein [Thermaurantiacus tibetensis]|uniref:helix-hairpin-helix domain-containing protein n=1 Tax=Thermaurantiacus tibetensis TaxID=2759035 RepID=UPI00188E2A74|nr:helix-hairpin-helix domain-containing protein [Thermaurantiacus tibetensis]